MKTTPAKHPHLKSRIFMRLFFSYVIIIVLLIVAYGGYIISMSRSVYRQGVEQAYAQKAIALSNAMDVQLLGARNIIAGINSSETIREVYSRIFVERKTVESMLLYRAQAEMKSIKTSSNNLNIYNVMLSFRGDTKAFTASSVIAFDDAVRHGTATPYLGVTTVSALWGVHNSSNIQINKDYLIYGDLYYGTLNSSTKGMVLVLFEQGSIMSLVQNTVGPHAGVVLRYRDQPVLQDGVVEGEVFSTTSSLHADIAYDIYVEPSAFVQPFSSGVFLPLFVCMAIGLVLIIVTYFLAKRHYSPFGSIERIIEATPGDAKDEVEGILSGIRSLIGERNGYRERMITISPYARQGMLHGMLTGNLAQERLQILIDEQYIDLKMPFFVIALANIAYVGEGEVAPIQLHDIADIIQHVSQDRSTEEMQIACYRKDPQNLFIIANANLDSAFDEVFFALHKAIMQELDDTRFAVTFGVGRVEDDLGRLREACEDAERALEHMLIGGRGAVYFQEQAQPDAQRSYYFPREASRRLARDFAEGNLADLHAFLDELYAKNVVEADMTPENIRLMVDELHVVTRNALQAASGTGTTHLHIGKIEEAATIDEIFAYYRAIYETVCAQLGELVESDQSVQQLKEAIVAYMDAHYLEPDLSLAAIADHFGVSTKFVGLVCKERLGNTYLQYVREKQIHFAVELLRTTNASLEAIAAQSGFTNMLTFRRNFKAVMGMNPSDYRQ